ncbi:glycoside hydrolase family 97 protein [Mangrovibacterium lignilyticum]|uniref:glycoside hydrolase family 97 protein n=1 Tax=Mangrovibacterium lignilyticum TaxID=2668052 RepID=UPI001967E8CD|nr:glycoside hydrolase family 97 protein [Mangrovibacterium lignilyticum]
MKRIVLIVLLGLFTAYSGLAQYVLKSPNGKSEIKIDIGDNVSYSVFRDGVAVVSGSAVSYRFASQPPLGNDLQVKASTQNEINESWKPVLKRESEVINHYNELILSLEEKRFPRRTLNLTVRAYNDGVAFRNEFTGPGQLEKYTITDEGTTFDFSEDFTCWAADYKTFESSQETEFLKRNISDITNLMLLGLPVTLKVNDTCYAAITEAAIVDFGGMFLKPTLPNKTNSLKVQLSPRPGQGTDGEKDIITIPHKTPWRVIMLGDTPGNLVESELVCNLNDPCAIEDPSWIKPGLSAWDHWWSAEVQMDTKTIKQYIDLASEMGWPYQLIDWQWYGRFNQPDADITTVNPDVNMPEVLDYAKSRGVKCWVWLYWTDVDRSDIEKAFALYEEWGLVGIKIDFMDREDQEMVNWYHKIVKTAAKYHLMVDFHGAYKPDGFRRTYPNLLTREGVMGNEYNKWSNRVTPEHCLTLPFTRMLAGPMDFTPGGFLNRTPEDFKCTSPANVLGTRCFQLAEFVVYDSPFMVACDHPDNYKGQEGAEFLKKVKSVWDDTKVLNGQIGEYITMARRSGDQWFIGSMTNSDERELEIKLDFLGSGKYRMVAFEDVEDSSVDAEKLQRSETTVSHGDKLTMKMVAGGGFAAYLVPVE